MAKTKANGATTFKTAGPDILEQSPRDIRIENVKGLYNQKPIITETYAGQCEAMRKHILEMSLFPNIYNQKFLMKNF